MGREAGRHRKLCERYAHDIRLADENPDVIERGAVLDDSARLKLAQPRCHFIDRSLAIGNKHQSIARFQNKLGRRHDVLMRLADHRDLNALRQLAEDGIERAAGGLIGQRHLAHMELLRLGRESRLHVARHEVDAQDRADHAERICDRVADRGIFVPHHVERRLQGRGARHRARIDPERMADLDAVGLSEQERDNQPGNAGNERKQVVLDAGGTAHALRRIADRRECRCRRET